MEGRSIEYVFVGHPTQAKAQTQLNYLNRQQQKFI